MNFTPKSVTFTEAKPEGVKSYSVEVWSADRATRLTVLPVGKPETDPITHQFTVDFNPGADGPGRIYEGIGMGTPIVFRPVEVGFDDVEVPGAFTNSFVLNELPDGADAFVVNV